MSMASDHQSESGHSHSHNSCSCGICGIEKLFNPPLPSIPLHIFSPPHHDEKDKDKIALGKQELAPQPEEKVLEDTGEEDDEDADEKIKKKKKVLENNGGSERSVLLWPPPLITSLRTVMRGKPCSFVRFDHGTQSYVVDQVNIPKGPVFHAFRQDGTLKLFFNPSHLHYHIHHGEQD